MSDIENRLLKAAEVCEQVPNTTIGGDLMSLAFAQLLRESAAIHAEVLKLLNECFTDATHTWSGVEFITQMEKIQRVVTAERVTEGLPRG